MNEGYLFRGNDRSNQRTNTNRVKLACARNDQKFLFVARFQWRQNRLRQD